jgi:hypothetical protein
MKYEKIIIHNVSYCMKGYQYAEKQAHYGNN